MNLIHLLMMMRKIAIMRLKINIKQNTQNKMKNQKKQKKDKKINKSILFKI